MAMFMNITEISDFAKFGTESSVCTRCLKRRAEEELKKSPYDFKGLTYERNKMLGSFTNKKMLVIRHSGLDHCICESCLADILVNEIKSSLVVSQETLKDKIGQASVEIEKLKAEIEEVTKTNESKTKGKK